MADEKSAAPMEDILADPEQYYPTPSHVLEDDRLSVDQKDKVLAAMEHTARELMTAASENMAGGESSALDDVLDARRKLAGDA